MNKLLVPQCQPFLPSLGYSYPPQGLYTDLLPLHPFLVSSAPELWLLERGLVPPRATTGQKLFHKEVVRPQVTWDKGTTYRKSQTFVHSLTEEQRGWVALSLGRRQRQSISSGREAVSADDAETHGFPRKMDFSQPFFLRCF